MDTQVKEKEANQQEGANGSAAREAEGSPKDAASPVESANDSATGPARSPADELAALAGERDRLAQEKAALYDQLLRKQADFENFRKRMEREKKEFRVAASMEAVKTMLPILDGLERALSAPGEANGVSEFRKGVELLHKQMLETLKNLGLEPIETRGQKFDPHLHHAVEVLESEEHEDQTIVEECQRGYRFQHRLLRPAMVRVTVRPKKNSNP